MSLSGRTDGTRRARVRWLAGGITSKVSTYETTLFRDNGHILPPKAQSNVVCAETTHRLERHGFDNNVHGAIGHPEPAAPEQQRTASGRRPDRPNYTHDRIQHVGGGRVGAREKEFARRGLVSLSLCVLWHSAAIGLDDTLFACTDTQRGHHFGFYLILVFFSWKDVSYNPATAGLPPLNGAKDCCALAEQGCVRSFGCSSRRGTGVG